jgi:hypothetical protein
MTKQTEERFATNEVKSLGLFGQQLSKVTQYLF